MAEEARSLISGDVREAEEVLPDLTDGDLRTLYEAMILARAVDSRCSGLHEEGRIGFYVPSAGLEAVSAGSAHAVAEDDWLFPSHRDVAAFLLRGGSLRALFDQVVGNGDDPAFGRQLPGHHTLADGRFVSVGGPVATRLVQAAGCAMAMRLRNHRRVVLASFGAAAAARSDFHDGLSLAVRRRAPLVLLCRSPVASVAEQPGGPLTLARAHGVSASRVDGDDILAVYAAVVQARSRALDGGGPTFIDACVAAVPARSGDPGSAASGGPDSDADPVVRYRRHLERRGLWNAAWQEELDARHRARIREALAAASAAPPPPPASVFEDVLEERHGALEEQRRVLGHEGSPLAADGDSGEEEDAG